MIILAVDTSTSSDDFFEGLAAVVGRFLGPETLVLRLPTHDVTLGWSWQVDGSEQCVTALSEFGVVITRSIFTDEREGRSPGS